MKKMYIKLLALALACFSGLASAHIVSSALGKSTTDAAAVDKFDIVCTDDSAGVTHHLAFQVKDNPTKPEKTTKVRIMATALGQNSPIYTDTVDTNTLYSPATTAKFAKGAVVYRVTVSKTRVPGVKGPESYVAQVHCQDIRNNHTSEPDDPIWIQNQ